jgi:hypothetical protein
MLADPYIVANWRPIRTAPRLPVGLLLSPQDDDLRNWTWWCDSWGYLRRAVRVGGGARPAVYMHRLVLARVLDRVPLEAEIADHINHNPLDNRRENLRVVDAKGNSENRSVDRRNLCAGLRGVSWHAKSGKWEASVGHNGKKQYLGLFTNPEEAAAVAARRRAELGFLSDRAANQSMELGNDGNAAAAA